MVACIVKRVNCEIVSFTPVINSPHNDIENGQPEVHYHADYRFIKIEEIKMADGRYVEIDGQEVSVGQGFKIIDDRTGFKQSKPRIEVGVDGEIEYHPLPVINENQHSITQQIFIRNSTFKHKCIHKGKCPHRGFNLSQTSPIDGIIKCPQHGLEFDSKTGKITQETIERLESSKNIERERNKIINKLVSKVNKIKEGDVLSLEEYDELKKTNYIYSIYENPVGEYIECEWQRTYTGNHFSKPLTNQPKINFKVKI